MAALDEPSSRYGFIDCGVPTPTVKTLPIRPAWRTALATPGAEEVHSPTRPFRCGWALIRSLAIDVALASSSPAYTIPSIFASGYFCAVYRFCTAIQEFRLAAV